MSILGQSNLRAPSSVAMKIALALTIGSSASACTDDAGSEENIFPSDGTTAAMTTSTTTTTTTTTNASMTSTTALPTDTDPPETDTNVVDTPRTYRFTCIDIQGIGNAGPDAFQAQVLENTWVADIAATKINILLEVAEDDPEAGEGMIGIRSGVGPSPDALCTEPSTESPLVPVVVSDGDVRWVPNAADGECSMPGSGDAGRTYELNLGADDLVYIYSEDDNTVTFNCTPDATPDAVPLRALQAEVSVDPTLQTISGSLVGCLALSEGAALCSCLGMCAATGPGDVQADGDCGGCPTGAVPLTTLLGDVGASDNCTNLLGEPAFDLTIGFVAQQLPTPPTSCG